MGQKYRLLGVVAPCCFLLLGGCTKKGAPAHSAEARFSVKAATVKKQEIRRTLDAVGSFLAFEEVTVSSEVEGTVEKVLVDVGDRVERGQVLLTIDPRELQFELNVAVARLQQALAQLGLKNDGEELKNDTDVPAVRKAAADMREAMANYQRASDLFRRALIPTQQLEEAEARANSTQATYDATLQQVQVARAAVEQYRAEVGIARQKLGDAQIKAPFSGWISERMASPGQYLGVRTPVATAIDSDPLKFTAEIPERMAPWIRVRNTVELKVDAYPDKTFTGTISRISPASTPQSRTFSIEAIIGNREQLVKPGFFGKISIATQEKDAILTVPADALFFNYGVYKVFAIEGGRLSVRNVTIGEKLGDTVEILSGVKEAEIVAAADLPKLHDGMEVVVAPH